MRQLKITNTITVRNFNIDTYLVEISKYRLITPEEEVILSDLIKQGDTEAKKKLVAANLRFVVSVAKQYQNKGLKLEDLINEGNLGLIKASERFDHSRGFKFISYAVWWIRQSIQDAINNNGKIVRLPLNQISLLNKVRKVTETITSVNSYPASFQEIIDQSDLPADKLLNINYSIVSLDTPLNENKDSDTLTDFIIDGNQISTDYKTEKTELKPQLLAILQPLSDVQKYIIIEHFFNEKSLEDISKNVNLTTERVRQIKVRTLKTLKQKCININLNEYL